jgi:tetratricopeptide (TPR) repeat protein
LRLAFAGKLPWEAVKNNYKEGDWAEQEIRLHRVILQAQQKGPETSRALLRTCKEFKEQPWEALGENWSWERETLQVVAVPLIDALKPALQGDNLKEVRELAQLILTFDKLNAPARDQLAVLTVCDQAEKITSPKNIPPGFLKNLEGLLKKPSITRPSLLGEALADLAAVALSDKEVVKLLDVVAARADLPDQMKTFVDYTQALRQEKENKIGPAAATLTAVADKGDASLWKKPARARKAATILQNAAGELSNPEVVFENPFGSKKQAETAYRWLKLAAQLSEKAPPVSASEEVQVNWALAAWYKETPDKKTARDLTDRLLERLDLDKMKLDLIPLVLVNAQAQDITNPKGRARAIADYARLVDFDKSSGKDALGLENVYKQVLQPALKLAAGHAADGKTKQQLASLYTWKGRLIKHHGHEEWLKKAEAWKEPNKDAHQSVYQLYEKAAEYDPNRAEYYLERGYARRKLPGVAWKELCESLEKDADDAQNAYQRSKGTKEEYFGAQWLKGEIKLLQSRQELDADRRREKLQDAYDLYTKAAELLGKKESAERLAGLHVALGTTCVELANSSNDRKKKEGLLEEAIRQAQNALSLIPPSLEKAYALCVEGNALEDQAFLLGLEPETNYDKAVEKFALANEARLLPLFSLNSGRCQFRQAKFEKETLKKKQGWEKTAASAIGALKKTLKLDPDPSQEAEAQYWLAKVCALQNEYGKADDYLEKARNLAHNKKLPDEAWYTLGWAQSAFEQALRADTVDVRYERCQETRTRTTRLVQDAFPVDAALLIGQTYIVESKLKEARETFEARIPKPLSKATTKHLWLIILRVECVVLNPIPYDEAVKCTSQAERAVQLASDPLVAKDLELRYRAHMSYANSCSRAADKVDGKDEERGYHKKAVEQIDLALNLGLKRPDFWNTYKILGRQHAFLAGLARTRAEGDEHYNAGLKAYKQAYAQAPEDQKKGVQAWRKDLEEGYKK